MRTGAPPDCLVEISDTGYLNTNIFLTWLKNFIKCVKPSVNSKVLLVLDGHSTHSKNLEAIELARENGVIILQLPGHTTHRLQPLDVAVFKPLELYYTEANEKWLRSHPGLAVSQYQVAQLLGEAYPRAAVMANAMNGFRKTGIWPVDRNVFSDVDFAPADVLTRNEPIERSDHSEDESDSDDSDDKPLARYVAPLNRNVFESTSQVVASTSGLSVIKKEKASTLKAKASSCSSAAEPKANDSKVSASTSPEAKASTSRETTSNDIDKELHVTATTSAPKRSIKSTPNADGLGAKKPKRLSEPEERPSSASKSVSVLIE